MQPPAEQRFLRIDQVAERLGISESSLRRLVGRGEFPEPVHLGRLVRWSVAAIEEWEQEQLQVA